MNDVLHVERSFGEKRLSIELSGKEVGEEKKSVVKYKKPKTTISQGSQWSSNQRQKCNGCGKRHTETCRRKNITCYQCDKKGHYKSECRGKFAEGEEKSII